MRHNVLDTQCLKQNLCVSDKNLCLSPLEMGNIVYGKMYVKFLKLCISNIILKHNCVSLVTQ